MTNYPYILFNQTPEDLRRIGARGGRAYGRNCRDRRALLEAPSEGAILAPHSFAPLSLLPHRLRTVLAAKGSLRRAQQRRALDRSGPFWSR